MARVSVSVSVENGGAERVSEVARRLEHAGLDVEQKLEEIGVVTGSIDDERADSLGEVEGVSYVECSRGFRLPPPDSGIQ